MRNGTRRAAYVGSLISLGVLPSAVIGVGARFRKLMRTDVRYCVQTLRVQPQCIVWIATPIAIQVPDKRELDNDAVTGTSTVIAAIVVIGPARQVDIHRIEAIVDCAAADDPANFAQNCCG